MTDDWQPYFTNVNGELASILLNLGLRDIVPMPSKPWLLWVWVYMQAPRTDGLSSSEEAPKLYEIEDALMAGLSAPCGALHCGRITTLGRREFYIYAETEIGFAEITKKILGQFAGYRCDLGSQRDEGWNQYLNVLYPTPANMESIQNQKVLDGLSRDGDVHSIEREVTHWVYFSTDSHRREFLLWAKSAGFGKKSTNDSSDKGKSSYCAVISRVQSVEPRRIDETTRELMRMANRFDGNYDGWETQVTTSNGRIRRFFAKLRMTAAKRK